MSMTGLGLEWSRRKHPELRPEHPEHRREPRGSRRRAAGGSPYRVRRRRAAREA